MNKSVNERVFPYPIESNLTASEILITRQDYTAMVENIDIQMSVVLDRLKALGEYEETVICISSDHGEMLGDFNDFDKYKPWVMSMNVPLVCIGPDIDEGKIIETYVTNMDLAGTFLDYAEAPKDSSMTTMSLRPFLEGTWSDTEHEYRDYVKSGYTKWRAVVQDINETVTWKFICCQAQCSGRHFGDANTHGMVELLFNVKDDLYELNNLINDYREVADRMRTYFTSDFCVPRGSTTTSTTSNIGDSSGSDKEGNMQDNEQDTSSFLSFMSLFLM